MQFNKNLRSRSETRKFHSKGERIMKKQSIKYYTKKGALKQIDTNKSKQTYMRGIKKFTAYAEMLGVKHIEDIPEYERTEFVQEYEKWMESECYSASTIHTYLAPICKAMGIKMDEIKKPKRSAGNLKRSRDESANLQGKAEKEKDEYKRLVNTQKALGIRRNELRKLKGDDLIETATKGLFVRVKRGKGGKYQLQKILPEHEEQIRSVWADVKKDQPVFSEREMKNKIDLHAMRADLAKQAYDYYAEKIKDPDYKMNLQAALFRRYLNYNKNANDVEKWAQENIFNDKPYVMRGENRENAISHGRPTEYNRLAMMAVSVFHLSHWRLDVTSVNYLA